MIENGRTGLLWNLFMSSPEVKSGKKNLVLITLRYINSFIPSQKQISF